MDYAKHPSLRRKTAHYRARRNRLTGLWLCAGIVGLAALGSGRLELAIIVSLFATFVSFAFLDEHEQSES